MEKHVCIWLETALQMAEDCDSQRRQGNQIMLQSGLSSLIAYLKGALDGYKREEAESGVEGVRDPCNRWELL